MARGVNKWIGIGNCCADPEIRYMPSGGAVCNVTVACNDSYKDKNTGEKIEKPEFVRVVFFNKLGEIAGKYLKKGSKVYMEGSLRTKKWEGQDGKTNYTTEIVANELNMLDSRQDMQTGQQGNQPHPSQSMQAQQPSDDFDDDIPW